jgi:hypothetical protein
METTLQIGLVHYNFRKGFPFDLPLPDEHDREPWQTAEVFRKFQVEIGERGSRTMLACTELFEKSKA